MYIGLNLYFDSKLGGGALQLLCDPFVQNHDPWWLCGLNLWIVPSLYCISCPIWRQQVYAACGEAQIMFDVGDQSLAPSSLVGIWYTWWQQSSFLPSREGTTMISDYRVPVHCHDSSLCCDYKCKWICILLYSGKYFLQTFWNLRLNA